MSMSGSTDAYKLSESCFQGVRLMLTKCSTESLGDVPFGGTLCPQRGNASFPTWEQVISKVGILICYSFFIFMPNTYMRGLLWNVAVVR